MSIFESGTYNLPGGNSSIILDNNTICKEDADFYFEKLNSLPYDSTLSEDSPRRKGVSTIWYGEGPYIYGHV